MAETDRPHIAALPDIDVSAHPAVPPSDHPDTTPSVLLSAHSSNTVCPPQLSSGRERLAWEEFISGVGPLTRIVYARAVRRFLDHLFIYGLTAATATPAVVRDHIDALHARPGHRQHQTTHVAAIRTRKQHLAAIRHFYDRMVERHASVINPAASVRSPRLVVERGETSAIRPEQVQRVLDAIDTRTFAGHRDHTLILTLATTAARVGAIATLTRGGVVLNSPIDAPAEEFLILREKNDKRRQLPIPHELRAALSSWLQRLGPADVDAPVFPSVRNGRPTQRPLTGQDIRRIVRRRLLAAGVTSWRLSCHSFRAGAATALLASGMELTRVQDLLGHADPRTTRLYDARSREAQLDTVSRLSALLSSPLRTLDSRDEDTELGQG